MSPPPDAVVISCWHFRDQSWDQSWDRSWGSYGRQQSSKHVLQLIRTRLRPGNRRHPFRLANVVRVLYDIGRINQIRTRLTNPTDRRICMTLPDAASIHHVSYRSLGWYTVQVPLQLTTAMTRYNLQKALTAKVSRAVAKIEGSSLAVLVVLSNCLL